MGNVGFINNIFGRIPDSQTTHLGLLWWEYCGKIIWFIRI